MGEAVSRLEAFFGIGVFEKGVVVMVSYGRTFNPVEHINPLMVLEGGKASHAVACWEDSSIQVVRPVLKESPRPTVSEGLPAVQVLGLCLLFIALLLCRDFFFFLGAAEL